MELEIPKFSSETEEADWWYENRERLSQQFLRGAMEGTLKHGSTVLERTRSRRQASSITVPLSPAELDRIHELAQRRGIEDAAYAHELLKQALDEQS